jgi:hypothetical protein
LLVVESALQQQLVHVQNRIQRRAEFVAHRRQETRLGLIGVMRAAGCILKLLPFALGDTAHELPRLGKCIAQRRV